MKKRLIGLLLSVMLVFVCVGCGAESTTTEPNEAVETTEITQESATEQTEEATATQEETAEPTPETSEETTAETEPETTETTETAEPEPTEEPEPQATYTYTDMSAIMYTTQTVNVRNQPSTDGEKIGSLFMNQEVQVISRCNETGWYKFIWTDGREAYVSNKYLTDEKVEVAPPANNNSGSGSAASNSCPYTLWQPVDEGDKIWWYVTQPDPNWETSGHKETQAWMMDTICDRGVANSGGFVPEGYYGYAANEWIFMGTYSEGNVYYQSFYYAINPR